MDKVDDTSKAPSARNLDVSAETLSPRTKLEQTIEAQRAQLLQAHGVLTCLYDVLLHADGDDAVSYAQALHVAANLVNNTAEELDNMRIGPMIDALVLNSGGYRVEEPRALYVISRKSG